MNETTDYSRGRQLSRFAISILFAVFAWGGASGCLWFFYRFPSPYRIVLALGEMYQDGSLAHDLTVSLARWAIGWSVGTSLGISLGIVTARIKLVRFFVESPITLFKASPFITLIPLSLRIFGLAEMGKFMLIGWIAFTVSWVITHEGVQQMPRELRWLWRSTKASSITWFTHVIVPYNWPHICASIRASANLSLIVVAAVEMGGAYERSTGYWWSEGLGYRVFRALDVGRDDLMLAGITVFAVCGLAIDNLVVFGPKLIAKYSQLASKLLSRRLAALPINETKLQSNAC